MKNNCEVICALFLVGSLAFAGCNKAPSTEDRQNQAKEFDALSARADQISIGLASSNPDEGRKAQADLDRLSNDLSAWEQRYQVKTSTLTETHNRRPALPVCEGTTTLKDDKGHVYHCILTRATLEMGKLSCEYKCAVD